MAAGYYFKVINIKKVFKFIAKIFLISLFLLLIGLLYSFYTEIMGLIIIIYNNSIGLFNSILDMLNTTYSHIKTINPYEFSKNLGRNLEYDLLDYSMMENTNERGYTKWPLNNIFDTTAYFCGDGSNTVGSVASLTNTPSSTLNAPQASSAAGSQVNSGPSVPANRFASSSSPGSSFGNAPSSPGGSLPDLSEGSNSAGSSDSVGPLTTPTSVPPFYYPPAYEDPISGLTMDNFRRVRPELATGSTVTEHRYNEYLNTLDSWKRYQANREWLMEKSRRKLEEEVANIKLDLLDAKLELVKEKSKKQN